MPPSADLHTALLVLLWSIVATQFFGAAFIFKRVHASGGSVILGCLIGAMYYQSRRTPVYDPLILPGSVLEIAGLLLFLWAARTIRGYFFSYILSKDEPKFVLSHGPFAHIRHPFYTSYMLTQAGGALIFPSWITLALFLGIVTFFWKTTSFEERKFARSPQAPEYFAYKRRAGRFFPK